MLVTSAVPALSAEKGQVPEQPLARYVLPVAAFDIEVRHEIQKCSLVDGATYLEAKRTVTISARTSTDESKWYSVYPSTFGTGRTKIDATLQFYENGTLKSLNATGEDRTGAIVSNVLGFVVNVVKIGALFLADGQSQGCSAEISAALSTLQRYNEALATAKQELVALDLAKPDPKTAEKTKTLQDRISYLSQRKQQYIDENLVLVSKSTFVPSTTARTLTITPSASQIRTKWGAQNHAEKIALGLSVQAFAAPSVDLGGRQAAGDPADGAATNPSGGSIVIRQPVRSIIAVCNGECVGTTEELTATGPTKNAQVIQKLEADVPQYGHLTVVPIRAKAFESKTLAMTFSSLGRVETLTLKSGSKAEAASAALNDTSAKVLSGSTDIADAASNREIAELKLEKQRLDAERERIEARKKLREAQSTAGQAD